MSLNLLTSAQVWAAHFLRRPVSSSSIDCSGIDSVLEGTVCVFGCTGQDMVGKTAKVNAVPAFDDDKGMRSDVLLQVHEALKTILESTRSSTR